MVRAELEANGFHGTRVWSRGDQPAEPDAELSRRVDEVRLPLFNYIERATAAWRRHAELRVDPERHARPALDARIRQCLRIFDRDDSCFTAPRFDGPDETLECARDAVDLGRIRIRKNRQAQPGRGSLYQSARTATPVAIAISCPTITSPG
jgi:hypothetical protein